MTRIHRQILARYRDGVDVAMAAANASIPHSVLLRRSDRNRDGVLDRRELASLLRRIKRSPSAPQMLAVLRVGRRVPDARPDLGAIAARHAAGFGADYAYESAPRSPNARLSANRRPMHTRLRWLRRQHKCNQFVGDILTLAGFKVPMFRIGRSYHYVNAARLPKAHLFATISRPQLSAGDLIVVRWGRRSNQAHVEIVTQVDRSRISTVGAHRDGAYVTTHTRLKPERPSWRAFIDGARRTATGALRTADLEISLLRVRTTSPPVNP